jgi:hypothetical protein
MGSFAGAETICLKGTMKAGSRKPEAGSRKPGKGGEEFHGCAVSGETTGQGQIAFGEIMMKMLETKFG